MPTKVKRIRRRRRLSGIPLLGRLPIFRHEVSTERLLITIGAAVVGIVLIIFLFTYGTKFYHGWRENRLLQSATKLLHEQDFDGATAAAQKALLLRPDSLPAYYILAEATEKQNKIETVTWRAQIARLLPEELDSHLNLASAAL